jgi:hypothetical protein
MAVKRTLRLILCAGLVFTVLCTAACSLSRSGPVSGRLVMPVEVVSVSALGEPVVGNLVTLHFEVTSYRDSPEARADIYSLQAPDGVIFFTQGVYTSSVRLATPLVANQTKGYDVQFCVLRPGRYNLHVDAGTRIGISQNFTRHSGTLIVVTGADSAEAYGSDAEWVSAERAHGTPTPTPAGMPRPTAIPAAQCAVAP